jgi:hypothetical protein
VYVELKDREQDDSEFGLHKPNLQQILINSKGWILVENLKFR